MLRTLLVPLAVLENSLLAIAQASMNAKKPDDAIAYLEANLELYPKSLRTYQALAQARSATGDRTGAIRDLERALAVSPDSPQVRSQLQQLRGQ